MIAARDRARRLQAALGEGAPMLMGCSLIVLHGAPQRTIATRAAAAANEDAPDPAAGAGATSRPVAERVR
jgi:hypothetical protein